ncbi:MAG TPA: asparagine synthase (glutamine-hydrolyzing) [Chitinophagales bacterium]|nr:asparagine synthase (glutamine-hydrolyzing) [Chitinophagales bacterium]
MCGILGLMPASADLNFFTRSLDLLVHRGPDGRGVWQDGDGKVILGHRRLSILDLSDAGFQPMHNERYAIIHNGEIYNFREIRTELEKKGHLFKSQTDTEVILEAYARWGADCLQKFNGMWAFAIWDKKEKTLFLARDRFGKKPLFYAFAGDAFVFGSEMKALVPFLPKVNLSKDFQWMRDNVFAYEPTEKCLIEGITRFPSAHYGIYRNGKLTTVKYWDTHAHLHSVPRNYSRQVEEFRDLFLDACKIRLRSDVPVGTALSGGVDSSATIAGIKQAAKLTAEPPSVTWQNAFIASMPGSPLDETSYAKKVCAYLKIQPHVIEINPEEGIKSLEEYLYHFEELYITSPVPMVQTYRAERNSGVYVSIDGHGADELFSGYDTFLLNAFWDCGLNPHAISSILKTYRGIVPPFPQFKVKEVGIRDYFQRVSGSFKFKDFIPHIGREIKKAFEQNSNGFNRALYHLFHTANLPTLLRNYDRYSMMSGVEIRMPFLDHRVVAYCFSIPWTSKIRNGYTKALLRDAMAPFLPREIMYRKYKMGFQTPIVDWLKGAWKNYFLELVNSKDFKETGIIQAADVKAKIENVINNENATYREGEQAYASLQPYLWEKFVFRKFQNINAAKPQR